ncbi:hypothetical protein [Corynebacterium guaraldiae]|uniref:hypothetical protein n=1 Tax=Corynebacterium guaraldiae TaxID=3051103 RepID=UPI0011789D77|nr:hypothetical protein [Corynebacterium guaraldiae]TRX43314.1 hypothetical protein FNY89_02330 [Corynebacterium guaraldiae]TRX52915.1 hypothetical protein FNY91_05475 [Corynebacterium guaraldiae]
MGDAEELVFEMAEAGLNAGEEIFLVEESSVDPHIDFLKFSGMKITAQKSGDDIVLSGTTYSAGFRASVEGPFRAQETRTFSRNGPLGFTDVFDSLVEELLEKDSQVPAQTGDDKPVDRNQWESRIERGRQFGEKLFG